MLPTGFDSSSEGLRQRSILKVLVLPAAMRRRWMRRSLRTIIGLRLWHHGVFPATTPSRSFPGSRNRFQILPVSKLSWPIVCGWFGHRGAPGDAGGSRTEPKQAKTLQVHPEFTVFPHMLSCHAAPVLLLKSLRVCRVPRRKQGTSVMKATRTEVFFLHVSSTLMHSNLSCSLTARMKSGGCFL